MMIKMFRYSVGIFIVCCTFLLSSCDYMDVNNMSIVTGISLDKQGNKYIMGIQVVNPSEIAGRVITQRPEILVYHIEAANNEDILGPLSLRLAKTLDTSHTKVVIIGERLARENVVYFNDLFDRNILFNQTASVLIAQGGVDPTKLLTTLIPDSKTTANRMEELLINGPKNYSSAQKTNFDSILVQKVLLGVQPTIQGVWLRGEINDKTINESVKNQTKTVPTNEIILGGIGILKDFKLIGFLDPFYTPFFNALRNEAQHFKIKSYCGKNKYNKFMLYNIKVNRKVKIKDGIPHFHLEAKYDADLVSSQCNYEESYKTIVMLEKVLNQELEKRLIKTVAVIQQNFAVDSIGFGETVRREDQKFWSKHKTEWDDYFVKSKFTYKAKGTIRSYGLKTEQPSKKVERYIEVGPNE